MARRSHLPNTDVLSITPEGAWRIAGTRVSIESVVREFWQGATPEEICQDFSSLSLAQVYSVIGFYLGHRDLVDAYLKEQDRADRQLRKQLRTTHGQLLVDLRRRLQARRRAHPPAA